MYQIPAWAVNKQLVKKFLANVVVPSSRRWRWLLATGLVLTVVAIVVVVCLVVNNRQIPTLTDKVEVVTHSTDTPSEQKPGSSYTWRGSANDPKKIVMPTAGIDAFIQNVGVDQNNQIAVPNNIHIAGWFVDSVRPGHKGLSIIDGHVDGRTANEGVFAALNTLNKGDEFTVEMGSGRVLRYHVSKVTTVATDEAASVLYSQNPSITSQLNLITCTGTYLKDQKTYDRRTIVASELMQ